MVGVVKYDVTTGGKTPGVIKVSVLDANGTVVGTFISHTQYDVKATGQVNIDNANFWWPYTMSKDNYGYLYTLKVRH